MAVQIICAGKLSVYTSKTKILSGSNLVLEYNIFGYQVGPV